MTIYDKMRQVIVKLVDEIELARTTCGSGVVKDETLEEAKILLKVPPRNCDIGDKDEQSARFLEFCNSHKSCQECFGNETLGIRIRCFPKWSQMPYEQGEER